jgi:GT2 family glycosyltransferase
VTPAPRARPRVRVVVVDHDGGDITLECLAALADTDWDPTALEIVVVDNGSAVSVAARVERDHPGVRVVRSSTNRGFAGGNNLALGDLDAVDFVALVNNDVTVERGWLRPLVDCLEHDPQLGAAGPKILFRDRYRRLDLSAPVGDGGRLERRALGVRISGVRGSGDDLWGATRFVRGTWGPEWGPDGPYRWTTDDASLLIPARGHDGDPGPIDLRLDAPRPGAVTFRSAAHTTTAAVTRTPAWHTVVLDGTPFDVVNSIGTDTTPDGYGVDIGSLEEDRGQYEHERDIPGWYGGAVLLRTGYLADVGTLDERLFLYYEDLELSIRGREAGWRYRYVPASVVRHRHAATSSRRWRDTAFYTERNRLLVVARHRGAATRAAARFAGTTLSYGWRDLIAPIGRGERPRPAYVVTRTRALGGFLTRGPAMLRSRPRGPSSLKHHPSPDR